MGSWVDSSDRDYDPYAETTVGGSSAGPPDFPYTPPQIGNSALGPSECFWIRANDGSEFGPIDRMTLDRWFRENRIAPGFQMRTSETGLWQSAEIYRPVATESFVQTAVDHYVAPPSAKQFSKSDTTAVVLVLAAFGFFFCGVFSLAAVLVAQSSIGSMDRGEMDPTNRGLVRAGFYAGILGVFFSAMWIIGAILLSMLT